MTHMLCKNQATFCENCIFIRATASSILQLRTGIPHLPLYSLRHKWERITKMSIPTKLLTDILMAVLFLLLMADRHTGAQGGTLCQNPACLLCPLDFPSRGGASRNLWEKTPDGARAACPFHAPALVQSGVTRPVRRACCLWGIRLPV